MKTLHEMSSHHLIIEAILLFIVIIAAFYIVHSIIYVFIMLKPEDKNETSELNSRDRYKATEDLMKEINNNQN